MQLVSAQAALPSLAGPLISRPLGVAQERQVVIECQPPTERSIRACHEPIDHYNPIRRNGYR